MKRNRWLGYFFLILMGSCSQTPVEETSIAVDQKNPSPFQTAGVEQFFLPEPPTWKQFSQNGECYYPHKKVALDFSRLHSTYNLTLNQLIELQVQYYEKLNEAGTSSYKKSLTPQEEAQLFYEVLERVRAGVKRIKVPSLLTVRLIWKESKNVLKFTSDDVLVSLCLSTLELEHWLEKNYPDQDHPYLIGHEALTAYSESFLLQPKEVYLWSGLFDPQIKLVTPHLYTPTEFGVGIIYQR